MHVFRSQILQEYNRDSFSNRLDLLRDMPLHVRGSRRQIIQQGPMKMKDAKNSHDVYCYLFTDMFLITKPGKRSGTTNPPSNSSSSLTSMSLDGGSNRNASMTMNKILKPPIRLDRLEVREYDRRGETSTNSGNAEPNAVRDETKEAIDERCLLLLLVRPRSSSSFSPNTN